MLCVAWGGQDTLRAETVNVLQPSCTELYLQFFVKKQLAEKAEKDGQNEKALAHYQIAHRMLLQIKKTDPSWRTTMVDYRLQAASEKIKETASKANVILSSATEASQGVDMPSDGRASVYIPSAKQYDEVELLHARLAKAEALNNSSDETMNEMMDALKLVEKILKETRNTSEEMTSYNTSLLQRYRALEQKLMKAEVLSESETETIEQLMIQLQVLERNAPDPAAIQKKPAPQKK